MKIKDFILQFSGEKMTKKDGLCRVRIFEKEPKKIILITDLGELGTGHSVTNYIENICISLETMGYETSKFILIEHYEYQKEYGRNLKNSFDIVTFNENNKVKWCSIETLDEALEIIGCCEKEIEELVSKKVEMLIEIDKKKQKISEIKTIMNVELIKREKELKKIKISKKELSDLINNSAKEQDISTLIKKDMSILAEVFAHPSDEYICFPDFRHYDGVIDFVIFSGRSKMDVYFVEIKGADFNIVNKDKTFNSKITKAEAQLRNRNELVTKNDRDFREKMHRIRKKAISGQYTSYFQICPKGELYVDMEKEVKVYNVIIGGRTINDLEESKLRHELEQEKRISRFTLHSWDSFIRQLKRD